MSAIGYVIATGVTLLMLPALPFVATLGLFTELGGESDPRTEYAG